jgi:hypothetical protein
MDLGALNAITGKLEAGKAAGWLSDYLVAWHGTRGKLTPDVTVWRAPDLSDEAVMSYPGRALAGLVAGGNIAVAGT